MGVFDIFRRLLSDRAAADASLLQDIRRHEQAERGRKRREKEIDDILKMQKIKLRTELLSLRQPKVQPVKPIVAGVKLDEILGFESEKRRRRRK